MHPHPSSSTYWFDAGAVSRLRSTTHG